MTPSRGAASPVTLRSAYVEPAWLVASVSLAVDLDPARTRVVATMVVRRGAGVAADAPFVLQGERQTLVGVAIDGTALSPADFLLTPETLTIAHVPAQFTLRVESLCSPADNTALEGLYLTGGVFCTQCEAEGFRRITYFPDRPDVLAVYTVEIRADPVAFPVLLSNGDLVAQGPLPDGRAFARWHDPWPKPSYLFALVAGRLAALEDEFITRSGRHVLLQIYATPANLPHCTHAMSSLRAAMRWDEDTHGLEYDLGRFMIYCADDFNLGGMENKGLNIFNARALLAAPDRSTDEDFARIEGIVAHEYFHNWTGNRVTARDWFQLSLKEGWTVFRDQEFSADRGSRAVERIAQMVALRAKQWPEDAGPQAHPVRPDAYAEINNFYTATVYEKGAELVRMLVVLIGPAAYRRGCDLFFARHDGQAVTCEDFVRAMADASGRDLAQFRLWYSQAGTPRVRVETNHDPVSQRLRLTFVQSCPPTPGQPDKQPMHIPVRLALLGPDGRKLMLRMDDESGAPATERVIELTEAITTVEFAGVGERPVPSLLRGFSAPVRLDCEIDDAGLLLLLRSDDDLCNCWETMQRIRSRAISALLDPDLPEAQWRLSPLLREAYRIVIADEQTDAAWRAQALRLPSVAEVADGRNPIQVERIADVLAWLAQALARDLDAGWTALHESCRDPRPYAFDAPAAGRRALANRALQFLAQSDAGRRLAADQFQSADNMTAVWGALIALNDIACPERAAAMEQFRSRWRGEPLLLDKWLTLQATSALPGRLAAVSAIWDDPSFDRRNPNRVRALLHAFALQNWPHFHQAGGAGYAFVADQVLLLDRQNPQLAARLAQSFDRWRSFDPVRQAQMRTQLERIAAASSLSGDVAELVAKAFGN